MSASLTSGRPVPGPIGKASPDLAGDDGPGPSEFRQLVGRPAGRPSGRVLLGAFLITAAAVTVFAAVLTGRSSVETPYVVAARALPAGAVVGAGDLATERMSLSRDAATSAFRSVDDVIGRTLAVPVPAGDLLQPAELAAPADASALRPVSVPVDPNSLSSLQPGDPVDVLSVVGSGSGGSGGSGSPVSVVFRGATLLSMGRPSSSGIGSLSGSSAVATLGVPDLSSAEAVVAAAHGGTVVLIRADPSDGRGPGDALPASGGGHSG